MMASRRQTLKLIFCNSAVATSNPLTQKGGREGSAQGNKSQDICRTSDPVQCFVPGVGGSAWHFSSTPTTSHPEQRRLRGQSFVPGPASFSARATSRPASFSAKPLGSLGASSIRSWTWSHRGQPRFPPGPRHGQPRFPPSHLALSEPLPFVRGLEVIAASLVFRQGHVRASLVFRQEGQSRFPSGPRQGQPRFPARQPRNFSCRLPFAYAAAVVALALPWFVWITLVPRSCFVPMTAGLGCLLLSCEVEVLIVAMIMAMIMMFDQWPPDRYSFHLDLKMIVSGV